MTGACGKTSWPSALGLRLPRVRGIPSTTLCVSLECMVRKGILKLAEVSDENETWNCSAFTHGC